MTQRPPAAADAPPLASFDGGPTLAQVEAWSRLAMTGIVREYPHKPGEIQTGPAAVRPARELHPVFYGCFDWHSAVHSHWLAVRLLKDRPRAATAADLRALLRRQFAAAGLAAEAAFFGRPEHRGFERMYGWAWALRLAEELHGWDDDEGRQWFRRLQPLAERLAALVEDYLPRLSYPVRTGVHGDTAFALGQCLDYARGTGHAALEAAVTAYARDRYLDDRGYNAAFEPSGEDFFSPALNEADLLRRVLAPREFAAWLDRFLPDWLLPGAAAARLLTPVEPTDVTDGRLVHLAGLNFSRGWCLQGIAATLPADDPRQPLLRASERAHAAAGLRHVESGRYEGEHWLATFAVYLLQRVGCPRTPGGGAAADAAATST